MSTVTEDDTQEMTPIMTDDLNDRSGLAIIYLGKSLNAEHPLESLQVLRLLVQTMKNDPPTPDFTELRYEIRSALIRLVNADATFDEEEYDEEMTKVLHHIDEAIKLVS